eukprot:COSAG06_NODE_8003_length_2306_cov_1.574082_5_plen_98_part_01
MRFVRRLKFQSGWNAILGPAGGAGGSCGPRASILELPAAGAEKTPFLLCYRVSRKTEYLPRQARDKCIGKVETKVVSAGRQNLGAGQFCPGARNYLAE